MTDAALHPDLEPLAWLVGTWSGLGVGGYPTVGEFRFAQEVVVTSDGGPSLSWRSRSWVVDDDGRPLRPGASEAGSWRRPAAARARPVGGGTDGDGGDGGGDHDEGPDVELLLAHADRARGGVAGAHGGLARGARDRPGRGDGDGQARDRRASSVRPGGR